jgi:dTMP kinase
MAVRGHALDKFEREASGFFDRVRTAYLARAQADPRRFRVVDSSRPLADVRADLARIVDAL